MTTPLLPTLFVSHGAPLFATDAGTTGPALHAWAQAHAPAEALRGIVVMSPHWMARGPTVMTNPAPATWHDFGGFPAALYQLQYPAPGSPELGQQVLALLQAAGIAAQADDQRPLDHGAWVPLMHLYPAGGRAGGAGGAAGRVWPERSVSPWGRRWPGCARTACW